MYILYTTTPVSWKWPMGNPMVTWRNRSRDHRIPHRLFPIGGPLSLKPSLYV